MSLLRFIVGLALLGFLIVDTSQAQEGEECPPEKVREVEDLPAELAAHREWLENIGHLNPDVPGRANFCNADLTVANLEGADLRRANLEGADLFDANLEGARLAEANLEGANLPFANLEEADLSLANLEGADLSLANLVEADLSLANLEGAALVEANLEGADLGGAELQKAKLIRAILQDAKLTGADLSGARYQPATAPAQGYLSGLIGLDSVTFCPGEGSGLTQLRKALKAAGLRDLEREATYALEYGRTRHKLGLWPPECKERSPGILADIEGRFRLVFFEWTTGYGLSYGRPIWLLLGLIGLGALIYVVPIGAIPPVKDERLDGIYKIWSKERVAKVGQDQPERLHATGIVALLYALYFSILSAFHFGWRDLNVGNWIARIQRREYALRATGWVRMVSGVQSLTSVYLIAMWVLTYFGRPFE